jgi:WD40 repeat protein
MLHAFKGHTKAVTGIQLHPVSGLAITTSLDGFVKILNLEAMTELYCVNVGAAILELKVISLSAYGSHSGIMFSLADATIKLWRITSCCTFFSVCTSKISKLTVYENLQLENEKHHAVQQSILRQEKLQNAAARSGSHGSMFDTPLLNVDDPGILIDADGDDDEEGDEERRATTSDSAGQSDGGLDDDDEEDRNIKTRQKAVGFAAAAAAGADERILVGFSSQDLRAFTQKGVLLGRFEPEHVVDGIKAYAVSVFQKLLFVLTDSDKVRVHDLRRYTCPLLKEHIIKGSTIEDSGLGTSCVLIDCIPNNALRSSGGSSKHHSKHDSRGVKITSPSAEEFLLVGMKNGAVLFMDTLTDCEVAMNIQAHNGIICELKYRQTHKELFVLGSDFGEVYSSVRVFQLPQMELLHEVGSLKHISCFEISSVTRMFAIGNATGVIRLFTAAATINTKSVDEPEVRYFVDTYLEYV